MVIVTARWELDVARVINERSGDARPLTTNDRLHWARKAKYVAAIREAAAWAAKAARIGPQEHLTVQLHYAPGDWRRRDPANLTATQKPAVDGLVDAGVVPDDTPQWVTELMPMIHAPDEIRSTERRLWLVIEATERAA